MGNVFLVQGDGLVEMEESGYDSEADLQRLLELYPRLLAGDQMNAEEPRRWLLIRREVGLPDQESGADRWSVDHLFLDQDAVPTIVETKRSSNTEIRRKIVGQMMDYAASAVAYWPVERIQSDFEDRCRQEGLDPDQTFQNFIGEESPEDFWKQVKTNLQAGRVRLLFVADCVPPELKRIVEFLNEQMDPAEILAVEVRRYAGDGVQTLVPRVFGASVQAQNRKASGGRKYRDWDLESFLQDLSKKAGPDAVRFVRRFLDMAASRLPRTVFGRGYLNGSLYAVLDHGEVDYYPVAIWTDGRVEIQFERMKRQPPFDRPDYQQGLRERLNRIPGVDLPETTDNKLPNISIDVFYDDRAVDILFEAIDWFIDQATNPTEPN